MRLTGEISKEDNNEDRLSMYFFFKKAGKQ